MAACKTEDPGRGVDASMRWLYLLWVTSDRLKDEATLKSTCRDFNTEQEKHERELRLVAYHEILARVYEHLYALGTDMDPETTLRDAGLWACLSDVVWDDPLPRYVSGFRTSTANMAGQRPYTRRGRVQLPGLRSVLGDPQVVVEGDYGAIYTVRIELAGEIELARITSSPTTPWDGGDDDDEDSDTPMLATWVLHVDVPHWTWAQQDACAQVLEWVGGLYGRMCRCRYTGLDVHDARVRHWTQRVKELDRAAASRTASYRVWDEARRECLGTLDAVMRGAHTDTRHDRWGVRQMIKHAREVLDTVWPVPLRAPLVAEAPSDTDAQAPPREPQGLNDVAAPARALTYANDPWITTALQGSQGIAPEYLNKILQRLQALDEQIDHSRVTGVVATIISNLETLNPEELQAAQTKLAGLRASGKVSRTVRTQMAACEDIIRAHERRNLLRGSLDARRRSLAHLLGALTAHLRDVTTHVRPASVSVVGDLSVGDARVRVGWHVMLDDCGTVQELWCGVLVDKAPASNADAVRDVYANTLRMMVFRQAQRTLDREIDWRFDFRADGLGIMDVPVLERFLEHTVGLFVWLQAQHTPQGYYLMQEAVGEFKHGNSRIGVAGESWNHPEPKE